MRFEPRSERPEWVRSYPITSYWNVYDNNQQVGWLGVFALKNKLYTDIEVYEGFKRQGYFKRIYDHYIASLWDGQTLYALIALDNTPSIKAHEKYGCNFIKQSLTMKTYLVKNSRYVGVT